MDIENLLSFLSEIAFPNTIRKNQLTVLQLAFVIILQKTTFPMFAIQNLFLCTYDQNLNYEEIAQLQYSAKTTVLL